MDTIRPLATITILAVLGLFLAMKINQSPVAPIEGISGDAWEQTDPRATEVATAWPGAAETAPPATTADAAAKPAASVTAAPAMPELPMPMEIPTARYGAAEQSKPEKVAASGRVPSLGTTTADMAGSLPAVPPQPETPQPKAPQPRDPQPQDPQPKSPEAVALALPVAAAAGGRYAESETTPIDFSALDSIPPAKADTPTPREAAPADEMASLPALPSLPAMTPPASQGAGSPALGGSPFDLARPAIDAALERGELSRAHLLLTQWYSDPTLTPAQKLEVEQLVSQLAGSVIYSTDHLIEPAHEVQSGETLETIAAKYNVPWQLLAKINGVSSADGVRPGQSVKVIRGPFQGMVDLSDQQLVLMVGGRYAGRFPVRLDGAASSGGEWTVEQKKLEPVRGTPYAAYDPSAAAAAQQKVVVLRRPGGAFGPSVVLGSPEAPSEAHQGRISVAQKDLDDLYDILSVGSQVTIRL
ncbi:LysM domain protein [Pirellulimonas nuda]|uniref:LysM domain protein n=1 Tax=Pirellulimonas nuda TaxID=2528009 RepID=A0A518D6K1_9BACT|nr:LysM peptidoglycan-binding domain-containing protein [Pirellulimonas nuda]QDU87114.1 LysM domain protein [Pirellulimonas nuda]